MIEQIWSDLIGIIVYLLLPLVIIMTIAGRLMIKTLDVWYRATVSRHMYQVEEIVREKATQRDREIYR